LQELLKRLQDRHVECAQPVAKKAAADAASAATVNPDTQNVRRAMMKLEQANARAKNHKQGCSGDGEGKGCC
jgi:hypothetical protein